LCLRGQDNEADGGPGGEKLPRTCSRRSISSPRRDHYEAALTELINAKRNGKTVGPKPRPKGENVVDLMEALKRSIGNKAQATKGKKPRKATAGQKEMLLPINGKRAAKQDAKKSDKPATARTRKRA
jgi:DNA end-binding protein Ku